MRWLVEVSSLGKTDTQKFCVDAESWQRALQSARSQRGEDGPMSGFSIELLEEGYRAVDPLARVRFVVKRAPDDMALTPVLDRPSAAPKGVAPSAPSAPSPALAAIAPPGPSTDDQTLRNVPTTSSSTAASTSASLNGKKSPVLPVPRPGASQPPPPVAGPGEGKGQATSLGSGDSAVAGPTLEGAGLAAPPAIGSSIAGLPAVKLLTSREQNPNDASPLTYREYAFAVPEGTSEEVAANVLREQLRYVEAHIATAKMGKLVNLGCFDVEFTGKPPRPPLATLTWKDWKGEPVLAYPRRGSGARKPSRPPSQMPASLEARIVGGAPPVVVPPAAPVPREAAPFSQTQPIADADGAQVAEARAEAVLLAGQRAAQPQAATQAQVAQPQTAQEAAQLQAAQQAAQLQAAQQATQLQAAQLQAAQQAAQLQAAQQAAQLQAAQQAAQLQAAPPTAHLQAQQTAQFQAAQQTAQLQAAQLQVAQQAAHAQAAAAAQQATQLQVAQQAAHAQAAAAAQQATQLQAAPQAAQLQATQPQTAQQAAQAQAAAQQATQLQTAADPFRQQQAAQAQAAAQQQAAHHQATTAHQGPQRPQSADQQRPQSADQQRPQSADQQRPQSADQHLAQQQHPDHPRVAPQQAVQQPAVALPGAAQGMALGPPPEPTFTEAEPRNSHSQPPPPPLGMVKTPSGRFVRGRVSGDELISSLFESMHDLHFLRDALDGGQFCLALATEVLPARAALIHFFDVEKREWVVACTRGKETHRLLTMRSPDADEILREAARKRRALVVPNASNASADRYLQIGGGRSLIVAPIMQAGRALGALEIINPLDGMPFTEDEGNAMTYIAEQFAEFLGSRGIVLDRDRIQNAAAR